MSTTKEKTILENDNVEEVLFGDAPLDAEDDSSVDDDDSSAASVANTDDSFDNAEDDDSVDNNIENLDDDNVDLDALQQDLQDSGNEDNAAGGDDDFDSDDDDSDDDENYLQKFNDNIDTHTLEKLHPSVQSVNNDEVAALSRVVRDAKGNICDPMHTTMPFVTKYEKARIIGARAEQLDRGAVPMIQVDPEMINGRFIAELEFKAKKIPFIIARPLPSGKVEYWKLEDLEDLA